MNIHRPMLAGRLRSLVQLTYPLLATPKLDGIRCLKVNGNAVSRAFKPIQNRHIAALIEQHLPDGVDGELMAADGSFQDTQSGVMTQDGKPEFEYWVFDWASCEPYKDRVASLSALPALPWVKLVLPQLIEDESQFLQYEDSCLSAGHEGVILRSPLSPYKCGRATIREQYMMKWKRYVDSEAVILGFTEARENCNPVVPNAFGLSKRPGGQLLKVPKGTLGSLSVRDVHSGVEFEIGTGKGLTTALRQHIWDNQLLYLGRLVRYCYQDTGVKEKPRFPSFTGFRDPEDM